MGTVVYKESVAHQGRDFVAQLEKGTVFFESWRTSQRLPPRRDVPTASQGVGQQRRVYALHSGLGQTPSLKADRSTRKFQPFQGKPATHARNARTNGRKGVSRR